MEEETKKEDSQEKSLEEKIKEGEALEKMTVPELKEIALKIEGVTGVHAMKKEDLLKVIKEARGIPLEDPAKSKVVAGKSGIHALKQQVVKLRNEKQEARLQKEKKRVNVLRRRINRLKKRTKKLAKA